LNSFPENPEAVPKTQLSSTSEQATTPPSEPAAAPLPDPAWNGWDVLRILIIGVVVLLGTLLVLIRIVPGTNVQQRANNLNAHPELVVIGQMIGYLLLLGYMYILVTRERRRPRFWQTVHWKWPASVWSYLAGGVFLQLIFLLAERFLPFPKETPFDALLQRPYSIFLIAVFAVTLGPLMEELFFRGFLYPVLSRRLGVTTAISTTAFGFALIHATQYGYSWASILLIFVFGLVLGVVRERTGSVAASFLVHVAYNGTIMVILFVATSGFRHLEKLNQ